MSRIFAIGLVAPTIVAAVAAACWLVLGAGWGFIVLLLGGAGIVGYHLWYLERLTQWAARSDDTEVPEGRGPWGAAFSALHRRMRTRVEHERDLAHLIERFSSAAEALPDGMVVLDSAHRIRWMNARAQVHLGLDAGRDAGRRLLNLVRQPEVTRHLEGGEFSDPIVVDSARAAGVTLSIQVVPFGEGEKLLVSRDISRLEAVARMRREFIANVSHELKTPLTVVRGFLETVQDLDLEPRQRERYLALMSEQATSMERLVNDLLTLSTLESEGNPVTEAPFAAAPLLQELARNAEALSKGQHAIVLDAGEPATVTGSRDELASAFGNLISNAIRYTAAGGTITLSWRRTADGGGEFVVSDTGIGIAPEHIPRLTERFYRVDRSRSRATGGTGLGLAIVKHVLLRHQASLDVVSELGRGSTFAARLPERRVAWAGRADDPARAAEPTEAPTST